ncbi:MAG: JDVT-CTERM system glutamic-type intramembrane protease MrtJ [Myxococcota bacterium]
MNYQRKILNSVLLVFIIVNLILIPLPFLKPLIGRFWVMAIGGAIFLLATLILARREGLDIYILGIYTESFIKELSLSAIVILIVFPIFFFFNHLYQTILLGHQFQFIFRDNIPFNALINLLLVAIPEEVFFRGYIQQELMRAYNSKKIFRVLSYSNLLTSILFSLGHFFINPNLGRIAVFFPSLLFGFLRERSGSIYPSIILHWLSNVVMYIAIGMYD